MSQYTLGTVAVAAGSAIVVGTDTVWQGHIATGHLFSISGSPALYQVAGVIDNTHLTLTAPWGGETGAGLSYAVTRDFTPRRNFPIINPGDINAAALVNRALAIIDEMD